jgi:hypothetical protein
LTIDEIDDKSFWEIETLCEHYRQEHELAWIRTGQIISYLLMPHMKQGSSPIDPYSFSPFNRRTNVHSVEDKETKEEEMARAKKFEAAAKLYYEKMKK